MQTAHEQAIAFGASTSAQLGAIGIKLPQFDEKALALTPKVDDSQLTALNKHLDLKETHFKEVQAFLKRSPLTPYVDISELKQAETAMGKLPSNSTSRISVDSSEVKASRKDIHDLTRDLWAVDEANEPIKVKADTSQLGQAYEDLKTLESQYLSTKSKIESNPISATASFTKSSAIATKRVHQPAGHGRDEHGEHLRRHDRVDAPQSRPA
ncbi:MAG: hypothetical protein F6K65_20410 [Moorea sp. SIO3C2]|nr:hypothetical protein [Moorena sp. SIO3C2]